MADTVTIKKTELREMADTVKEMAAGANKLMAQADTMVDVIKKMREQRDDALAKAKIMLGVVQLARKDVLDGSVHDFFLVQEQRIAELIAILKPEIATV